MEKTKDYNKFVFRNDNRDGVNKSHVERLKQSIQAKNLLEFRPIIVNEKFEVIDGQHRLLAAKSLGLEIYYEMRKNLDKMDIITLNVAKSWGISDYLNFYVVNGYENYISLKNFMNKNNLTLKVALNISIGKVKIKMEEFKAGKFVFSEIDYSKELEYCNNTINFIKMKNGSCIYTTSSRFYCALLKLVQSSEFDYKKWITNLERFIIRLGPRANQNDYYYLFVEIYNWRNNLKIE